MMLLLKIAEVLKLLLSLIEQVVSYGKVRARRQEAEKHEANEKKASDMSLPLEERAKALCEIEKLHNPNSDCD